MRQPVNPAGIGRVGNRQAQVFEDIGHAGDQRHQAEPLQGVVQWQQADQEPGAGTGKGQRVADRKQHVRHQMEHEVGATAFSPEGLKQAVGFLRSIGEAHVQDAQAS